MKIFEYNGEWYQRVEGDSCGECDFSSNNVTCDIHGAFKCTCKGRSDETSVVFKKLEKVGELNMIGNKLIQRYKIYPTTHCINVHGWHYQNLDVKSWTIDIEIKQNQEEMEEKKNNLIEKLDNLFRKHNIYISDSACESMACEIGTWFAPPNNEELSQSESIGENLRPFDLEAAKAGKPVCTRDGRKARIICFDRKDNTPIVALIERVDGIEILQCFYNDGKCFHDSTSDNDLMMLPEKKEGWVNVYKGIDGVTFSKHPYTSKDEAIKNSGILFGRIDTIKVSWEE